MLRQLKTVQTSHPLERAAGPVGLVATGLTTACCLGLSVALSLATSVGATFMTRDSTLKPILFATLALTCAASALTFWRHRSTILPLLMTIAASVAIYTLVYGFSLATGGQDTMNDGMGDSPTTADAGSTAHQGLSSGRQTLVWVSVALLLASQVWDVLRVRRKRTAVGPIETVARGPE